MDKLYFLAGGKVPSQFYRVQPREGGDPIYGTLTFNVPVVATINEAGGLDCITLSRGYPVLSASGWRDCDIDMLDMHIDLPRGSSDGVALSLFADQDGFVSHDARKLPSPSD